MRITTLAIVFASLFAFSSPAIAQDQDAGAEPVAEMDAGAVAEDAGAPDTVAAEGEDADPAANVAASEDIEVPNPEESLPGFALEAYEKVKGGKWREFAAMLVILIVFVSRKWGLKILDKVGLDKASSWLSSTDRGGVVLVALVAGLGAVANALYAGAAVDLELFKTAGLIMVEAIGGFVGVKKFLFPSDEKEVAEEGAAA
jgi:hypothetical protein